MTTEPTTSQIPVAGAAGPVLFLLNALGMGGSERKTVQVVNDLHRTGWNVHLAYLDARTILLSGVSTGVPTVHLGRKGKFSFSAIRALRSYLRREGISTLVTVNLYPLIYARASIAWFSSASRPKTILMINTTDHVSRKAELQMSIYRPLMRRIDKLVFGCHAQLRLWVERYQLDASRCAVIYNGIDAAKFAPGAAAGADVPDLERTASDFLIGAVGKLRAEKNQAELIAAFACLKNKLPNARLVLVGDGPMRAELAAAVESEDLSARVTFLGEIKDVRPILELTDVFVLPSVTETFSNAALEAMAMQKVVILSNTGGMPEMVSDGVDGFTYEQGDVESLAALIERLAHDPDTRRSMGKKARETILRRFSFARMLTDYQEMLR